MEWTYANHEVISLKQHPEFNEAWVRDRIVDEPSILGLGDVEIRDVEHVQPQGGRLDLLLRDPESDKRYEVELQLGATDESHIIRTIEYWDVERKRYPQYDHSAVIVAEDITTRFLNVIGLFNSSIPLIAIQLSAIRVNDKLLLHFTKVLDEIQPGEDEDDSGGEIVDSSYWEQRAPETIPIVDKCGNLLEGIDSQLKLNYKKLYIGLVRGPIADNFVVFWPRKRYVIVQARVPDPAEWARRIEDAGLVPIPNTKGESVRFRLTAEDLAGQGEVIRELFRASYEYAMAR